MSNKNNKTPDVPAKANYRGSEDLTNYENPSNIVFATDPYGVTSKLKREMISVASRIMGDPVKLALVEETLALLVKHIHARYEHTRANIGKTLEPAFTHPPVLTKDKE